MTNLVRITHYLNLNRVRFILIAIVGDISSHALISFVHPFTRLLQAHISTKQDNIRSLLSNTRGPENMGLVETFLLGFCLNSSCLEQPTSDMMGISPRQSTMQKKLYFNYLQNELKGMNLKIATVQNGALSYAVKVNGTWVGKGVAFDLLDLLQKKYAFNYSVVLPKENSLGTKKTGVFGLLYNKKVDVVAAFLPMTSTYWRYVHFATTLDVGEWMVLLKRPQESANGSGLLAPFTVDVWLLILLSVLVVGPVMCLVVSVQSRLRKDEKSICLMDCMWFVYGALLKQGTTITPLSDSTRFVFATWWVFVTILTAFYTANLTAFLTLSEFTLPIKNPKDIAVKKYPWVTLTGSVIEETANNRLEELHAYLKNSQRKFVRDNGAEILKTWVTQRDYIYIAEKPNVDILLYQDYLNKTKEGISEQKRCTYVVTPWSIFKRPRTFAYSKTFKFGQLFDKTLRDLAEVGLIKHYLNQGLPDAKICPLNLGNKERQLRNTDLLLTYYIVCGGFMIAIVIFITEIILKFLKHHQRAVNTTSQGFKNELNFGKYEHTPPSYSSLFFYPVVAPNRKKSYVNGREYWVIKSAKGNSVLVPVRAPSALLFEYYTN